MRLINFRGKNIFTNKWIEGQSLLDNGNQFIGVESDLGKEWQQVDPNTLSQFTGFFDKYGTKIFEGDYLELSDRICLVTWHQGVGCWDLKFIRFTNDSNSPDPDFVKKDLGRTIFWKNYKVVGNQFDNQQDDLGNNKFDSNTLKLIHKIQFNLEYAGRYAGFALARGEVEERENCISLIKSVRKWTLESIKLLDEIWENEKIKKD